MEAQDSSGLRQTDQLVHKKNEVYGFLLVKVAKHANYPELVVDYFWVVFVPLVNPTDIELLRKAFLVVNRLVVGVHCFLQAVIRREVLELTHPHHFLGAETLEDGLGLLNGIEGN